MPRQKQQPTFEDDEALARQLQEQYAAEFRQSQQQPPSQQPSNSYTKGQSMSAASYNSQAPLSSSSSSGPKLGVSVRNRPSTSRTSSTQRLAATTGFEGPPQESDEEYARRLEKAYREEELAFGTSSNHRTAAAAAADLDVLIPYPPRSGSAITGMNTNNKYYSYPDDGNNYTNSSYRRGKNPDVEAAMNLENAMQQDELRSSSHHSRRLQPRSGLSTLSSHSANNNNYPPTSYNSSSTGAFADSDEVFARRLQEEMRLEEERAARSSSVMLGSRSKAMVGGGTVTPITSESDDISEMTSDELMARKVEQELHDEELARRLAKVDQDRLSANRARQLQSTPPGGRPGCSTRRVLSYLIPAVVLTGAIVAVTLFFTGGFGNSDLPDWFPSPEDFRDEDPFTAKNASEVEKWRTTGDVGLTMEVISALESNWIPYFDTAVGQWDNGTPDALTLTKSYTTHDVNCDPINFKIKVCNGNYGDTQWRGINKVLITDGYIFASAARMNEFYFTGSSDTYAQHQYTMCHEMGHGFGLPHTDENFNNPDLGNCMDYTNNPQVNMQPDTSNYKFLEQLYGDVPGSSGNSNVTATKNESVNTNGGRRRRVNGEDATIPDWVMQKWRQMDLELNNHAIGAEQQAAGWRMLHQSDYGESHEIDLGGGFTVRVHKLYHRG